MYTGIGCASCQRSRAGLGIAPAVAAVIVQEAPKILNDIKGLFTGSSYNATHQQILQWVQVILSDPTQALSGNYSPAYGQLTPANAWLQLLGWAGNPDAYWTWVSLGGGRLSPGAPLGCESAHGCLADAQATVRHLCQQFGIPVPTLVGPGTLPGAAPGLVAPSPSTDTSGGTIYTPLPGGGGLNLPVPASSLLNATIGGIPVTLLVAGVALFAFAGGHRQGRR